MADNKTKAKLDGTKKKRPAVAAKAKPAVKVGPVAAKKAAKPSKASKTDKQLKAKNKGPRKVWKPLHILGLIFWPRFLRNSFKELQQVTWLSLKGSIALTVAVLFFAVIFVVFIGLIDMGLDRLFKALFLK